MSGPSNPFRLAVTVSSSGGAALQRVARAAALEWGLPYFERRKNEGLEPAFGRAADGFLVLGHDGWALRTSAVTLRFTPGMAALRIKRLDAGHPLDDVLLKLTELRAGDTVLDGTLGLGADALVCGHVVGPTGKVIAVEASLPMYALVSRGLKSLPNSNVFDVRHGQALDVMRSLEDQSVDCVVLDPMFDTPKKSTPPFELLRQFADHRPLERATIDEARRIARRWVVVKAGRHTREFERLGLVAAPTSRFKPTIWARVPGGAR